MTKPEILSFIDQNLKTDYQLTALTGDAGNRQYFQVVTKKSQTFILCLYKKDELASYDRFLNIHSLFSSNNIKAPQVLHENRDLCTMLLEDLGPGNLEDEYKKTDNLQHYQSALNALIRIQALQKVDGSVAHSYSFDVEKFKWELDFSLTHLQDLYGFLVSPTAQKKLSEEFFDLANYLVSLPQVVTHRDYHSRNIIPKNNESYIIDFQDARLGNPFYDLTSLIEDTYTGLASGQKSQLIDYYKKHSPLNFDANFDLNYQMQALQRSIKACGSFARLKNLSGTDRYLQYLKPSLENIYRYLEGLNKYPEITTFVKTCFKKNQEIL